MDDFNQHAGSKGLSRVRNRGELVEHAGNDQRHGDCRFTVDESSRRNHLLVEVEVGIVTWVRGRGMRRKIGIEVFSLC